MKIAHGLVVAAAAAAFACGGGSNDMNESSGTIAGNREPAAINDQAGQNRQTLTGCLLAGGDAGDYVLQVARADVPSAVSAAAPADVASADSWTFRIVPGAGAELGSHLNKRVSVEGFVDRSNAPVGTSGVQGGSNAKSGAFSTADANRSGTTANGTRDEGVSPQEMPIVRAESIQTVAGNCPAPAAK
jgi:hypothetical protein